MTHSICMKDLQDKVHFDEQQICLTQSQHRNHKLHCMYTRCSVLCGPASRDSHGKCTYAHAVHTQCMQRTVPFAGSHRMKALMYDRNQLFRQVPGRTRKMDCRIYISTCKLYLLWSICIILNMHISQFPTLFSVINPLTVIEFVFGECGCNIISEIISLIVLISLQS